MRLTDKERNELQILGLGNATEGVRWLLKRVNKTAKLNRAVEYKEFNDKKLKEMIGNET